MFVIKNFIDVKVPKDEVILEEKFDDLTSDPKGPQIGVSKVFSHSSSCLSYYLFIGGGLRPHCVYPA